MGCNLLINGVYWSYNPLTKLLLTSWDILVHVHHKIFVEVCCFMFPSCHSKDPVQLVRFHPPCLRNQLHRDASCSAACQLPSLASRDHKTSGRIYGRKMKLFVIIYKKDLIQIETQKVMNHPFGPFLFN